MLRIHDKIRQILDAKPGLTQRGLAARMGLNPAAVNRMLYGRRNVMAEEIPIIEDYLGERLYPGDSGGAFFQEQAPRLRSGPEDAAAPAHDMSPVPVYGGGRMGPDSVADWTPRHPAQAGLRGACAVYMQDETMTPRYFSGEMAYVHPGRPAEAGRDVLLVEKDGSFRLRRLLEAGTEKIRVEQLKPRRAETLSREDLGAIYAVVGRA